MLISISPWSNVYGVARTVIALATALTLIANSSSVLFPLGVSCGGIASISFYCLFPDLGIGRNRRWCKSRSVGRYGRCWGGRR